jgi:hypothetical protein
MLGLGSIATMLDANGPWRTPLLGLLDAPRLIGPRDWWLGAYSVVVIAVLFAVAVAASARWAGERRASIAFSGVAGPGILAVSYAFAGATAELRLHHDAALMAAAAGLLVSVIVAVLPRRRTKSAPVPVVSVQSATDVPIEMNADLRVAELSGRPWIPGVPVELAPAVLVAAREAQTPGATDASSPASVQAEFGQRARPARRNRDTKRLARGEREHVDWLEHMMSLPPDPALLTREK